MDIGGYVEEFEQRRHRRATDPLHWPERIPLDPAVVRSVQRFQVGEDGDGTGLVRAAQRAGDPDYLAAVRLFVAEEQHHARLLAEVLARAGAPLLAGHWTDAVFVAVRRAMGLRLELMTLMLAEVVALRYYRALRDGPVDPLVAAVAGRILADEQRHVPFHVDRLRLGFARTPRAGRRVAAAAWWTLMGGAAAVVALDHGSALRRVGVGRVAFVRDVLALFGTVVADVLGERRAAAVA